MPHPRLRSLPLAADTFFLFFYFCPKHFLPYGFMSSSSGRRLWKLEHIPPRAPQWVSELLRGIHTPASIIPWRFRDQGVCEEGRLVLENWLRDQGVVGVLEDWLGLDISFLFSTLCQLAFVNWHKTASLGRGNHHLGIPFIRLASWACLWACLLD